MGEKLDNLLRSFKSKKSPEMITDTSYDQIKSNPTCTINDLTIGIYNVFGVPLEEAAKINELFEDSTNFTPSHNSWESQLCTPEYLKHVPKMILKCVRFINDYGLREEGLYRVSGSGQQVKELKNAFIQHGPAYDIPPTTDVHAITSLIKLFVRELPEDLLPVKRHTFLAFTKQEIPSELFFSQGGIANYSVFTPEEQDLNPIIIPMQILQEILQGLSPYQFALVQTLTRHFKAITENSKYNRMTLASLSLILCPTLEIHKSVFHALILKSEKVWSHLHPKQSEISARSVKYDPRNILAYRDNDSFSSGTAPSSSNTSVADIIPELDPVSFNLFTSSTLFEKSQDPSNSLVFRPDGDYFDNAGVISFSNPLDYTKLEPTILASTSSSLSSFSDSSSSRCSDEYYSEAYLKLPPPQFLTTSEYRYKSENVNTSINGTSMNRLAATTTGNNRKLFLRKSASPLT